MLGCHGQNSRWEGPDWDLTNSQLKPDQETEWKIIQKCIKYDRKMSES